MFKRQQVDVHENSIYQLILENHCPFFSKLNGGVFWKIILIKCAEKLALLGLSKEC